MIKVSSLAEGKLAGFRAAVGVVLLVSVSVHGFLRN